MWTLLSDQRSMREIPLSQCYPPEVQHRVEVPRTKCSEVALACQQRLQEAFVKLPVLVDRKVESVSAKHLNTNTMPFSFKRRNFL